MSYRDWIDSLPESWEVKPLRAVADYTVSNVDKLSVADEIPVRLCNYSDVYNNDEIDLSLDFMRATATEHEIARFGLQVGDVVITKDSEAWDDIGVPAIVRESAKDLVCGYHLALLRPRREEVLSSFLFRCLQARPLSVQLALTARGITRFGLAQYDIGNLKLPIPPLAMQQDIVNYLERRISRLDQLVEVAKSTLTLLKERRGALVAAAVTGQIDVGGAKCL